MEEFVRAVEMSKLPPGSMLALEIGDEPVLIANVGGTFMAMGGTCNHEQWDLSEGSLEGSKLTCAGHGAVWDLATGKAEFDEELADEPLYEVKLDSGIIWVRRKQS